MVHQILSNETMCGITVVYPVSNINPYDDRTIIDKNGLIVTGFGVRHDFVEPTCAECSRLKQQALYHCSVHGYLSGEDVTYEEKCDYCGNSV